MEKIISVRSSHHHYQSKACVIWCFDDRFSRALQALAENLKLDNYDLVKIAGGAKVLASGKAPEKDFVLKQIKTSIDLHSSPKVILMTHSDCGAYGGLVGFGNDREKEKVHHAKDLGNAKIFLEKNLPPEVKIELVFADFEQIYKI